MARSPVQVLFCTAVAGLAPSVQVEDVVVPLPFVGLLKNNPCKARTITVSPIA